MHGYYLEEGEFLYHKVQERFRAAGENRTHDPGSFSSDALWRAGSEFNHNYTEL